MDYNETPNERIIMSKDPMTVEEIINTTNIRKGKKAVKRVALAAVLTVAAVAAVVIVSNKIETEDIED
jgi:hypothetical protein